MVTKYYYSADDVLDVKSVALIYSGRRLDETMIPQYAAGVGMFDKELRIDADEDGIISSVIDGMPDYDSFKFNNILVLDDSYAAKAFVELNSTIQVAEMGIKKITVVFEYDVKTGARSLSLSLNYAPHIGDEANAHKKLLSKGRRGERCALVKSDVSGAEPSERSPYYASLDAFADRFVKEGYLKYSGDLYYKDGSSISCIRGNSFAIHGEPKGFVEVGGEPAVACVDATDPMGPVLYIHKQSLQDGSPGAFVSASLGGMSVVGVSRSLIAVRCGSQVRLYDPEYIWNNHSLSDDHPLTVKNGTTLIADAVTGDPMLYTLSSGNRIDWGASSSSLRRILDSTMLGSDDQPGALTSATEGLAVYNCDGTPMLCSGQAISNPPYSNRFLASGYDKAVPMSAGAVFLRKADNNDVKTWVLAELVADSTNGRHRWELTDFGRDGGSQCFYPAIYKVARRKETTPYSSIAFGFSYNGLLYTCPNNNTMTSL